LADWLWREVGPPRIMSQGDFEKNYRSSSGIIYESPPPGAAAHIDLWNGSAQKSGSGYYLAKEIWFWKLK
ncbi:hypothetical protein, partial [Bradyrhizobium lablabi]|uniref:hypothetical protein n=1 Tax=Bradyrhizobium lablabi TaxID=722472 RepID=UPI001AECE611